MFGISCKLNFGALKYDAQKFIFLRLSKGLMRGIDKNELC